MAEHYRLRDIRFCYGDKTVLAIQAQSFERGAITVLTGENGVGKSTLLKLLAFVATAQSGEIEFAGKTVTRDQLARLRKSVSLVQQNPYLIKGSVAKNIELGLKFRGLAQAERRAKSVRILQLLGIEPLAEQPVKSLSGGEAQKVALGRTLVIDPDVILLDEPFTHLDHMFIGEFEALIRQLKANGKTVILTTHNPSQAHTLSDRIYQVADGKVREI